MGAQTRVQLAPVTPALAALLRERVQQRVGGVVTSVCRTPIGLFEVVDDAEIFYVDERADYLVAGKLIDLHTRENLTAQREDDAARIDFHTLPLDLAVKTVRGKGTRVFAVFEDPNCPYCKRFEKEIATLGDTTIYTFLYPILSRDAAAADDSYPKSRAIWCAPDRAAAWSQLMLEGKRLPAASQQCKHPLDEVLALGQKLHVSGTPTLIFSDGRRAPGAIPLDKVEQMLTQAEHAGAGASGSAAQ
jgi:thiol:disulfide interchange protein DsbC